MLGKFDNIRIAGVQATVPTRVIDNMLFAESIGGRRAKKFIEYTGISRRHLCVPNQSASDLSAYAADVLMDRIGWARDEIRILVNVTQSADLRAPSTAMVIQKRLGISDNCLAFDVNLGCSAYPSGIQIVSALLQNIGGKGLLLVGDGMYYELPEKPSMDSLLFGDGAAATAIEISEGGNIFFTQNTDGSRFEVLYSNWNREISMDGNAVLMMGLNEAVQSIINLRHFSGISDEMIDYYVLHQAQKIIIDGILKECDIDPSKSLISYDEYANTSSATLPVTLSANVDKFVNKDKVKLYLCGFGVGLTWNGMILDIDSRNIFPIIETDKTYADIPGRRDDGV